MGKGRTGEMESRYAIVPKWRYDKEIAALTAKVAELEKENRINREQKDTTIKSLKAENDKQAKDYEKRLNAMDALYNAEKEKLLDCARGKHYWLRMDKIIICKWCLIEEYQTPVAAIREGVEKLRNEHRIICGCGGTDIHHPGCIAYKTKTETLNKVLALPGFHVKGKESVKNV
jgi:hypothetical protein